MARDLAFIFHNATDAAKAAEVDAAQARVVAARNKASRFPQMACAQNRAIRADQDRGSRSRERALERVTHARAEIGSTRPETVSFTGSDIENRAVKTISSRDFTASLTKSLLSDLSLDIRIVGLGLGLPSGIGGTVGGLVGAAAPAIDTLLDGVLAVLGLSLGQADLRVHGAACQRAAASARPSPRPTLTCSAAVAHIIVRPRRAVAGPRAAK